MTENRLMVPGRKERDWNADCRVRELLIIPVDIRRWRNTQSEIIAVCYGFSATIRSRFIEISITEVSMLNTFCLLRQSIYPFTTIDGVMVNANFHIYLVKYTVTYIQQPPIPIQLKSDLGRLYYASYDRTNRYLQIQNIWKSLMYHDVFVKTLMAKTLFCVCDTIQYNSAHKIFRRICGVAGHIKPTSCWSNAVLLTCHTAFQLQCLTSSFNSGARQRIIWQLSQSLTISDLSMYVYIYIYIYIYIYTHYCDKYIFQVLGFF